MASIIWKSIYPLTNEAAGYLVEQGEITVCITSHHDVMLSEYPIYHPEARDPSTNDILEMIKRGHKAVGANEEEVSKANLERYFNTKEE